MGKKSPTSKTSTPKASPHKRKVQRDDRRVVVPPPLTKLAFEPQSGECDICHKKTLMAPIYTKSGGGGPLILEDTCCEECCAAKHDGKSYAIVNSIFECGCEDGKCDCKADDEPEMPDYWFSSYKPFAAIDRDEMAECMTCSYPVMANGDWGNFDYCFTCGQDALGRLQEEWRVKKLN